MTRPVIVQEIALLLGVTLIGAGCAGYDWRLACIVTGALVLAGCYMGLRLRTARRA